MEKDLATEQSLRGDVLKAAEEIRRLAAGDRPPRHAARRAGHDGLGRRAEDSSSGGRSSTAPSRPTSIWPAACRNRGSNWSNSSRSGSRRRTRPAAPIVVESYPTPISRAVDGPEAHLLISNGRVVFVPLEPLLEQFQSQAKRQVYKLLRSAGVDRHGRAGRRFSASLHAGASRRFARDGNETGRGGSYARLQKWTLVPDVERPGRAGATGAWTEGSDFRQALAKILPGRTTITIWVYPDGFDAFRQIRKELYRLGYTIAARPLPPGTPISGSPDGSKSAAQ